MVPVRVLVVRNDKIGDFMLAWPAFRAIKEGLPQAEVVALVPRYTLALAELCPWIDRALPDPPEDKWGTALAALLRRERFDAVVALFSTGRVAIACWRAGIPYRLAPATKLAQVFYTHRVTQRRGRSEKPEWVYNLELAARLLGDHGVPPAVSPQPPYLGFPEADTRALRASFCRAHGIAPAARLVFIHAGSGGSAVNLDVGQYAALAGALHSPAPLALVATAGPGETERAAELARSFGPSGHAVLSPAGIVEFARHIAFADLWISGSTGPLHIAGALDVPTAAFYPRRRSATPLRWQTLNSPERRLAFTPPEGADERDMSAIDVKAAAVAISARFLR